MGWAYAVILLVEFPAPGLAAGQQTVPTWIGSGLSSALTVEEPGTVAWKRRGGIYSRIVVEGSPVLVAMCILLFAASDQSNGGAYARVG